MSQIAVTILVQIDELKREEALRRRLYPKWINAGTLNQHVAELQLARLIATRELLEELLEDHTQIPAKLLRLRTEEVNL